MAFTYALGSSNAATLALSQVRLELGDQVEGNGVLPSGGNFQDEEIAYYLDANGNDVDATVAALAGVLSRHWATAADVRVGPRQESLSQVAARWATIAGESGGMVGAGSGTSFVTTPVRIDGYTPNGA